MTVNCFLMIQAFMFSPNCVMLTVKTAFLTLLYNDTLYIMDSEPSLGRSHADLTLIIRPDMRRFTIFDMLLEFKYVSLADAK